MLKQEPNRKPGNTNKSQPQSKQSVPPVRGINEDDDGYDPYTDWHDQHHNDSLFEEDPWH